MKWPPRNAKLYGLIMGPGICFIDRVPSSGLPIIYLTSIATHVCAGCLNRHVIGTNTISPNDFEVVDFLVNESFNLRCDYCDSG